MKLNLAERWMVNSPLRLALQRRVLGRMRAMAALPPGAEVLEIGCGRGEGAKLLRAAFTPGRLYLLDLDLAMARLARQRGNLALVGDAEALPLRSACLDAVFGFGFLHHVPDWRRALHEVARVLKPGGIYYIEEYYPATYLNPLVRHILRHPTEDRFRSAELRQGLAQSGLSLVACQEKPWWGMVGAARRD
ncbi:MAG: methyltransferase domain-containing protein [Desulfarculaceae bacterium]|nr:methyltransferase domain-containing protein [Desulfarculaceae bacterium]